MSRSAPDPRASRDAGLRRLLRAKRWILATSVALTGGLVALAAGAFPGRTINGAAASGASEPAATEPASPGGGSGEAEGSGSLTPPEQAPEGSEAGEQPSSGAEEAPVVSGGS